VLRFLIAIGIVVLVAVLVVMVLPERPSFYFQTLALLAIGTGGLYHFLSKVRASNPDFFVQLYLATIALKLLAYGVYLGIVIWKDRPGAIENVVFFMIAYIIFTALEVFFLWRKVNT